MGPAWLLFRLTYFSLKKAHWFSYKNHIILQHAKSLPIQVIENFPTFNITSPSYLTKNTDTHLANNISKHTILGFSHHSLNYEQAGTFNWHMNPFTKKIAATNIPWHQISDFGQTGDIKLIWEASRFNQVADIINAYSVTKNPKYIALFETHCLDWLQNNTFPYGVHYKCGQEIALRFFNWIIGLDYFHSYLSVTFKQMMHKEVYISLLRIEANINYAAKSVRNNHIISEASGLVIGGWLLPHLPESKRWVKKGLKYLTQSLSYQVYSDGAYIQHSINYQRLVLDTLSFIILISQKKKIKLPIIIHTSHQKLLTFLYSLSQKNGYLPNYGSNDGAYLFRLSTCNYRNFKPSLNLASALIYQAPLFKEGLELIQFFEIPSKKSHPIIKKETQFNDGGYYVLKNNHFFIMCRCHSYQHRPSQIDMLHIDIWHGNKNIFCDTGTYSYNTQPKLKKEFIGIQGHNTIRINQKNHMDPVLNFGLTNWTKSKLIKKTETHFIGEHYGYQQKFKVTHKREIILDNTTITIIDSIFPIKTDLLIEQTFNSPYLIKKETTFSFSIDNQYIVSSSTNGALSENKISDYYNTYQKGSKISFLKTAKFNTGIKTTITLHGH